MEIDTFPLDKTLLNIFFGPNLFWFLKLFLYWSVANHGHTTSNELKNDLATGGVTWDEDQGMAAE